MKPLLFIFNFLFISTLHAENFPEKIKLNYNLFFEDQPLGLIGIDYRKIDNEFLISAQSDFKGALKLIGDYQIISRGITKKNKFYPVEIQRKNIKKNKITTTKINRKKNKIFITSKKRNKEYDLKENTQDILSYFFEFNSYDEFPDIINFNILDSQDYKKYSYEFVDYENMMINNKQVKTIKYQGRVNNEEQTHMIWLSVNYRLPMRLVTPTNLGITIDQKLVNTNILNLL